MTDSERRSRLIELGCDIHSSTKTESRGGAQSFFAGKCGEACSALGLDYCSHDEDNIYASDPDDEDESNCLQFDYSVDPDSGAPILDEDSRTPITHEISHSARAAKRARAADKALERRMKIAHGRS